MALDATADAGAFYRIEPDGRIETISAPVTISNGVDWSLDGSLMYYIDTATGRMDVFDFDLEAGSATDRRPFIQFDESFGIPDGMTVDAEGGLWVAFYDGWAVRRFRPDGRLDRTIELPVARTTSCAFGGTRSRPAVRDQRARRAQCLPARRAATRRRALRHPARCDRAAHHAVRRLKLRARRET